MNGVTAAASGMSADELMQQIIMNNMANLQTPGFKQSTGVLSAFPQILLNAYQAGSNGVGAKPLGSSYNGVTLQESIGNFSQGQLQTTSYPYDVAITDPPSAGTSVYALTPQGVQTVSTLSFVIGKGGVVETANGDPVLPVDALGQPQQGARILANKAYKGLDLFGASGVPVIDANGKSSYTVTSTNGQAVSGLHVLMTSATYQGIHSFFAVENVDAQGKTRIALTRDGHFQVDSNNLLYDAAGQRVLAIGANGAPIAGSAIRMNPAYTGTKYFGANGVALKDANGNLSYEAIGANGQPIAGASFGATAVNVATLQPLGVNDYLLTPTSVLAKSTATLTPGAIEASNANNTQSMVDMLTVYRSYQADSKVIQTVSTDDQGLDQLGSVANL